jgi:hypothetical protein
MDPNISHCRKLGAVAKYKIAPHPGGITLHDGNRKKVISEIDAGLLISVIAFVESIATNSVIKGRPGITHPKRGTFICGLKMDRAYTSGRLVN